MALSTKAKYFLKSAMGSKVYAAEIATAIDAAATIETAEIAANAVTQPKIATNAVTARQIQDNSVSLGSMQVNSIDSDQYVDGSIDNAHIAANAIDSTSLNASVLPAYMVVAAGNVVLTETPAQDNTVSGIVAGDLVYLQCANQAPAAVNNISCVVSATDTITTNISGGDPSDTLCHYQVIRVVS